MQLNPSGVRTVQCALVAYLGDIDFGGTHRQVVMQWGKAEGWIYDHTIPVVMEGGKLRVFARTQYVAIDTRRETESILDMLSRAGLKFDTLPVHVMPLMFTLEVTVRDKLLKSIKVKRP